jgi:hypothetical protein
MAELSGSLMTLIQSAYCLILLQEALRRRKEEEDRVAQQNEFLNRSVRGSRKLQALESHATPQSPTGVVNDAYSSADDVDLAPPSAAEDDKSESLHRVIGEYRSAADQRTGCCGEVLDVCFESRPRHFYPHYCRGFPPFLQANKETESR